MDTSEFSTLLGVSSGKIAPLTVDSLQELPPGASAEEARDVVSGMADVRNKLAMGKCAVYPSSRFVRRTTLEAPNKAKDPNFFPELLKNQFKFEPEKLTAAAIGAADGREFSLDRSLQQQKELLLCGAKTDDFAKEQERVVEMGLYPERLELGTVVTLAALKNYCAFKEIEEPLSIDYASWLPTLSINVSDNVRLEGLDNRWITLFGLMAQFDASSDGKKK